MAEKSPSDAADVSPTEYAQFIRQLELVQVWLSSTRVLNHHGPRTPNQAVVSIDSDAEWEPQDNGFRTHHHYKIQLRAIDDVFAEIDVTFSVDFTSSEPMTDDIFSVFQRVNLPVNTWPFVREYISTTLGRMGWLPFTLPALKLGTERAKNSS